MADNKVLLLGGLGVAAFLLLRGSGSPAMPSLVTSLFPTQPVQPGQAQSQVDNPAHPTIPGAPILQPPVFNANYYLQYQYPALLQLNPNLSRSSYQLTPQDAQNYFNNYLELQEWFNTGADAKRNFGTNLLAAMQYHWTHFGVAYNYSFVPFTPPKNVNWTPPPPNPKSSGGGIFRTIVQAATTIAGGVLTVASAGTLTPLIVPATAALVNVEGAVIHGNDADMVVLNDTEINIINTSAAIIKKILPFYLKSQRTLVDSIDVKLNHIVSTYAP